MKNKLLKVVMLTFAVTIGTNAFAQTHGQRSKTNVDAVKRGEKVYETCEKSAEFPGGFDAFYHYLASSLKYPPSAKEKKVEGIVFLSFIVEKDGTISDIEVMRGLSEELNAEAVRVIKAMPKWKPAEDKGKTVRQRFVMPINFKLGNGK